MQKKVSKTHKWNHRPTTGNPVNTDFTLTTSTPWVLLQPNKPLYFPKEELIVEIICRPVKIMTEKNSYSIKEILALSWKAILKIFVQNIMDVFKIAFLLYKKISTVPRSLLVFSYVFQSLSLVYLPNEPHLVPVLGLTRKKLRKIRV